MTRVRITRSSSLLCAAALLVASGCLGEPFEACPDEPIVRIDEADARIWPPVVHTGYNGVDNFLAPIATNFKVDEWVSSNVRTASVSGYQNCDAPSILEPSGLVVAEAAGTTSISAMAVDLNGQSYSRSVVIQIESYTVAETELGKERYRVGEGNAERRACAGCHDENGVDHTPLEMAFHDDAAILLATTQGRYPDSCRDMAGQVCTCGDATCDGPVSPGYVLSVEHSWDLTPDEEPAIVAYMRSLRPLGL